MAESISNLNASNEPDQREDEKSESREEDSLHHKKQYEVLYEGEVSYEGESGFQKQYDNCTKHPNHKGFISEKEFIRQGRSCLPARYRDVIAYQFIKSLATLTTKLTVRWVSKDRPVGYLFADFKGKYNIAFPGTGTIFKVVRQMVEVGDICLCSECISSSTVCNYKELFTLEVSTARHVVYDQTEADTTTLHLSYFTEEKETEVTLSHGIVSVMDSDSDQSALSFTTHDTHLGEKLIQALDDIAFSHIDVAKQFNKNEANIFLPMVSYPHGCDKQVSFGIITKIHVNGGIEYNTQTCPGSSGAAIFYPSRLSFPRMLYFHHEGCNRATGNNVSGKDELFFDWSSDVSILNPKDKAWREANDLADKAWRKTKELEDKTWMKAIELLPADEELMKAKELEDKAWREAIEVADKAWREAIEVAEIVWRVLRL